LARKHLILTRVRIVPSNRIRPKNSDFEAVNAQFWGIRTRIRGTWEHQFKAPEHRLSDVTRLLGAQHAASLSGCCRLWHALWKPNRGDKCKRSTFRTALQRLCGRAQAFTGAIPRAVSRHQSI